MAIAVILRDDNNCLIIHNHAALILFYIHVVYYMCYRYVITNLDFAQDPNLNDSNRLFKLLLPAKDIFNAKF